MGCDSIFKRFVDFVQLPAKTACLFPFLLSLGYSLYVYRRPDWLSTVLFFISMLAFELSVTGLNSYVDTKTNGMPLQFSRPAARNILVILWVAAAAAALFLVIRTGLVVLVCGGICFLVGVLYSFGPAPISRMPLGEIFSGLFEGFLIPFLVVYINSPAPSLVDYSFAGWVLRVSFNIGGLFRLLILSLPAMFCIANIMLANNICDLPADIRVKRYTLPYYLGVPASLRLFAFDYYAAFAAVVLTAALRILPLYCLIVVAALTPVQKNIRIFEKMQSKTETFPFSVKNFMLTLVPLICVTWAAVLVSFRGS